MHFVNCCLTEPCLAPSLIIVENDTLAIRQDCKYQATLLASHDKEVWI